RITDRRRNRHRKIRHIPCHRRLPPAPLIGRDVPMIAFEPYAELCALRAPCTLEVYTRIHAELAFRTDALGNPLDYHALLAEHGLHHVSWIECESYWPPRVISGLDPRFDPGLAARFHAVMGQESERIIEHRS